MARIKTARFSNKTFNEKKFHVGKVSRKEKIEYCEIFPMMPRGYTAVQRAQLRKFERELYSGWKVTVE